mmetsp:Transcript_37780/g.88325  ORF Transcript_37780/g.88325 Transcript_37780/m.88325 type:complete len:242 (+) Transcript_37780:1043-1768(+)
MSFTSSFGVLSCACPRSLPVVPRWSTLLGVEHREHVESHAFALDCVAHVANTPITTNMLFRHVLLHERHGLVLQSASHPLTPGLLTRRRGGRDWDVSEVGLRWASRGWWHDLLSAWMVAGNSLWLVFCGATCVWSGSECVCGVRWVVDGLRSLEFCRRLPYVGRSALLLCLGLRCVNLVLGPKRGDRRPADNSSTERMGAGALGSDRDGAFGERRIGQLGFRLVIVSNSTINHHLVLGRRS